MSWRSLYAINNPNGRIGSTITATGVAITALVGSTANTQAVQNLASFSSLPVGVYSVSVSIPLANSAAAVFVIENWAIGASAVSSSSSNLALGSKGIVNFATTCAADSSNTTLVAEFLLNVPSVNTPATIFINSVITIGATANSQLTWAATTATTATIVATKMA